MLSKIKLSWPLLILSFLSFLLLLFSAAFLYAAQKTLPRGVTLSGRSVQGLTPQQFSQQMEDTIHDLNGQRIQLLLGIPGEDPGSFTFRQLGLENNKERLEEQVFALFHGMPLKRAWNRWQFTWRNLTLKITFPEDTLQKQVQLTWPKLDKTEPTPAQRIISADDKITLIAETNAFRVDLDALKRQLEQLFPAAWLDPTKAPANTVLKLPLLTKEPAITLKILKAQGIERKIGEFTTTYYSSGEGRIYNIQATAKSVQDINLHPGEIFDYSKIIQQTEITYGFKEAPVILNGRLVPGIGGGICQVSTTLYNAVLRSGLEIVERRNHSLPISYVPMGQDATYADNFINFKFRNSTKNNLLIRASTTSDQLTVKLFGSMPQNVTYDVSSTIVRQLEPPVKFVRNPLLNRGAQETIQLGRPGYIVDTYRTKKINGEEVFKEKISQDTYPPAPTLIATKQGEIRPDERNRNKSPQTPIVEDGIKGPVFR